MVYGVGTETMLNVSLKPLDVVKVLKSDRGNNTLLTLQIDGTQGPDVLIKDYQIDPVRRTLIHVDLLAVSADKPVRVAVPIDFSGLSPLEKIGATRRVLSRTVPVACLPADIPHDIEYSMEGIERPMVIYASELTFPENVVPAYKHDFAVIALRAKGADDRPEEEEETDEEVADGEAEE